MRSSANRPVLASKADVDGLFDALGEGDQELAATIFGKLKSLNKGSLMLLRELVGEKEVAFFPYRLKLVRRRRGRPTGNLLNARDKLATALARGDLAKVAAALHQLPQLKRTHLKLFGQLMAAAEVPFFPYRLQLSPRRPGKPSDPLQKRADQFRIMCDVADCQRRLVKREAAVAHVVHTRKMSRSTVFNALSTHRLNK